MHLTININLIQLSKLWQRHCGLRHIYKNNWLGCSVCVFSAQPETKERWAATIQRKHTEFMMWLSVGSTKLSYFQSFNHLSSSPRIFFLFVFKMRSNYDFTAMNHLFRNQKLKSNESGGKYCESFVLNTFDAKQNQTYSLILTTNYVQIRKKIVEKSMLYYVSFWMVQTHCSLFELLLGDREKE